MWCNLLVLLALIMCVWGCLRVFYLYFCRREVDKNQCRFDKYLELYRSILAKGNRMGFYGNEMVIVDPELIKQMTEYINDRNQPSFSMTEKLTHSIFNLNGPIWQSTRCILSRTVFGKSHLLYFTDSLVKCANAVVETASSDDIFRTDVDAVQLARDFMYAVVYRCVYGQPSLPPDAEFLAMSKALRHTDTLKFRLQYSIVPKCLRKMMWKTNSDVARYFKDLTAPTNDIRTNSILHKCIFPSTGITKWIKKKINYCKEPIDWDSVVQGNCAVFLLGGFTSTSSTIAFALYELAKNPGVQDRLYEEISDVSTFDVKKLSEVQKFVYLTNVVKETLRKYPPFAVNVRVCSRAFVNGSIHVVKGQQVVIPVCGIQRDENYYVRPDEFIPERFDLPASQTHYMPFGIGKRICIGEQFALLTIKMFLICLIAKFRIELTTSDFVLPSFVPNKFTTTVDNLPLRLLPRH